MGPVAMFDDYFVFRLGHIQDLAKEKSIVYNGAGIFKVCQAIIQIIFCWDGSSAG